MADDTSLDAVFEKHFPGGFPEGFGKRSRPVRVRVEDLVIDTGPLTEQHVAIAQQHEDTGGRLGSGDESHYTLKAIRHTHHRLAQYLAGGLDENKAAVLCNYTPQRVSALKQVPAFAELLAYYQRTSEVEWTDFVSAAADLSTDMLHRLQEILDESPEKLTPTQVMDAIKLLRDYSGNAPVAKSLNVNINQGLGDRLRAARERAQARLTGT